MYIAYKTMSTITNQITDTVVVETRESAKSMTDMSVKETVSEETVSEETVSEETVSEETVSEETVSEETVVKDASAEDTVKEIASEQDDIVKEVVAADVVSDASDATDATDASGIDCPEIANLPISMEDMKNRASSATTKIKSDIMENMKMMDMIRSRVDADRIKLATQSSAPTQPQSQSPPSIFDVITGLMGENGRLALERLESLPKKNAEQHINTIKSDIVTIAELFPPNPITGLISSTWR
jgi:hypothetical protein